MKKICRICLCNLDTYNSTNIFTTCKNDETLSEIITKIASIEIVEDEDISECICSLCVERLNMCYEFRKLIIQSDQQQRHSTIRKKTPSVEAGEIDISNDNIVKGLFSCNVCDKKYQTQHHFEAHLRSHMDEIKCRDCDETFKTYSEVRAHEKTHDETRYKCATCSKSFRVKSALTVHERRHFGIKQFVCEICSKGFVGRNELTRHLETHNELPPAVCPFCNRLYSQHRLQVHISKAHSLKTNICEFCEKKFLRFSDLERHKLTHTNELFYRCELCNVKFQHPYHLLKHTREEHSQ